MNKILFYLTFLIIFLKTTISTADTFYVSNIGNDANSGFKMSPFKTIQKAINKAIAGDSVFILAGTYLEKVNFPNSGTYDNPIVVEGIGRVVIKGNASVTRWTGIINIVKKENIKISNIKLLDSYWFGFYINLGSSFININNCSTYNTGSSGIYAASSHHIYFDSNIVRKACYQSLSTTASQECITLSKVNFFRIADNEVYESGESTNGGEGINAKNATKNGKIARNKVHDLIRLGIYVDAFDSICENIEVYSNSVFRCQNGIALASEQGGLIKNIKIFNNLVFNNKANGIIVSAWVNNGPKHNIKIVNNTCYKNGSNGWGGGIIVENNSADTVVISNNICFDNNSWGISIPNNIQYIVSNNLIYPFYNKFWTSEVSGINFIISNPMFTDTLKENFMLKLSSPCIKTGTKINAPKFDILGRTVNSTFVDMGAYQFTSASLRDEDSFSTNLKNKDLDKNESSIKVVQDFYNKSIIIQSTDFSQNKKLAILYNLNGSVVQSHNLNSDYFIIYLGDLPPAYYILEVSNDEERLTKRIFNN